MANVTEAKLRYPVFAYYFFVGFKRSVSKHSASIFGVCLVFGSLSYLSPCLSLDIFFYFFYYFGEVLSGFRSTNDESSGEQYQNGQNLRSTTPRFLCLRPAVLPGFRMGAILYKDSLV